MSSSTSGASTASKGDDPLRVPDGPLREPQDPELERILKMVESGTLSASDADELLKAMGRV